MIFNLKNDFEHFLLWFNSMLQEYVANMPKDVFLISPEKFSIFVDGSQNLSFFLYLQ